MGVAFLLTTLVIVVTPGPGVLYTIAAAISRGRRASLIVAWMRRIFAGSYVVLAGRLAVSER